MEDIFLCSAVIVDHQPLNLFQYQHCCVFESADFIILDRSCQDILYLCPCRVKLMWSEWGRGLQVIFVGWLLTQGKYFLSSHRPNSCRYRIRYVLISGWSLFFCPLVLFHLILNFGYQRLLSELVLKNVLNVVWQSWARQRGSYIQ